MNDEKIKEKVRDIQFKHCSESVETKLYHAIEQTIKECQNSTQDEPLQERGLCPCGHVHLPSSGGKGLRTYCVEGSQCNSDKCKDFVSEHNSAYCTKCFSVMECSYSAHLIKEEENDNG